MIHIYSDYFFDKLKFFNKLSSLSIPTIAINNKDIRSIKLAVAKLKYLIKKHDQKSDFGSGIVLKDRYGSGGYRIYKLTTI